MGSYNHHQYVLNLAKHLRPVEHCLKATVEEDPEEIEEQLSVLSGCVLYSVDSGVTQGIDTQGNVIVRGNLYQIVILQQTEAGNSDSVFRALDLCKRIGHEILVQLLTDANEWLNGLEGLAANTVTSQSIGPIGNNFHGIVLEYVVEERQPITHNLVLWEI